MYQFLFYKFEFNESFELRYFFDIGINSTENN